jgi:hypothetical protein
MDMNPKGPDEGDISNNDIQDGDVYNNGIQGMQLHAHHLDEIKIGSINVQLSPKGTPLSVQNLGEKEQFVMPLSHVQILMQNDKSSADYHADFVPRESASGLPQVSSCASGPPCSVADGRRPRLAHSSSSTARCRPTAATAAVSSRAS